MASLDASSLLITLICFVPFIMIYIIHEIRSLRDLPPGPRPLPILGNILNLLGTKPHKALTELAKKHGPVMTLRLGAVTTVVISSHTAAREVLQKNDHVLSSRTTPDVMRVQDHYKRSIFWLPTTSPKSKALRKACTVQMFSKHKLDITESLRRRKVDELLEYIRESSLKGQAVDIGQAVFTTVLNLISNTLFSVDMGCRDHEDSRLEMKELLWGLVKDVGTPNITDFFPVLRWIDPQGARRRMEAYFDKLFAIFDRIIEERTQPGQTKTDDMLDVLLNLQDRSELGRDDINSLLLDLFVAGVDTTHSAVEWAMSELLKHPEKMKKAREETRKVIGLGAKLHESDIPRLPYLQAIVKEIARLYAPFLLPHKADAEVDLCGYKIPKGTQVMVNMWAMGRDSSVWRDPERFEPERFLEIEIDIKGTDYELIPFGAGRRFCPGMPLGYRMLHLILASLIHSFDWELANGETPETMDMTEKLGVTLNRAKPLYATPTPAESRY